MTIRELKNILSRKFIKRDNDKVSIFLKKGNHIVCFKDFVFATGKGNSRSSKKDCFLPTIIIDWNDQEAIRFFDHYEEEA